MPHHRGCRGGQGGGQTQPPSAGTGAAQAEDASAAFWGSSARMLEGRQFGLPLLRCTICCRCLGLEVGSQSAFHFRHFQNMQHLKRTFPISICARKTELGSTQGEFLIIPAVRCMVLQGKSGLAVGCSMEHGRVMRQSEQARLVAFHTGAASTCSKRQGKRI